jgi:hypothetical protein
MWHKCRCRVKKLCVCHIIYCGRIICLQWHNVYTSFREKLHRFESLKWEIHKQYSEIISLLSFLRAAGA